MKTLILLTMLLVVMVSQTHGATDPKSRLPHIPGRPAASSTASNPGVTIASGEYVSFETEDHAISAYIYDDSDNPNGHNFYVNSGFKTITIGGSLHPFALYIQPTVDPPLNGSVLYLVVNAGGNVSLKQVEVGPANSAGSGYRTLRVLN